MEPKEGANHLVKEGVRGGIGKKILRLPALVHGLEQLEKLYEPDTHERKKRRAGGSAECAQLLT